ncbi:MAG: alpha/beta hydrolase [Bacilli bacterium]|nr:alpha/beta hydrolase [Bacilli bacterium]
MKLRVRTIIGLVAVGAIALYFVSGLIAVAAINGATVDERGRDDASIASSRTLSFFKTRNDYPELSSRVLTSFQSDGAKIQGYLYQVPEPKGLVVYSHGLNGCADDHNAAAQAYFVRHGYDVFAYDGYGCGASEGSGQKNLAHFAVTLRDCLDYLDTYAPVKNLPYHLVGHSAGAYASGIQSGHANVKSAFLLTGFDNLEEEMFEKARVEAGGIVAITKPAFAVSCAILFGNEARRSAASIIAANTHVSFLVTQARNDRVVPEKASLYRHLSDLPHVEKVITENSHSPAWQSQEGYEYYQQKVLDEFEPERHSLEECKAYAATLDLEKIASVDEFLFGRALAMMEKA